MRVHFTMHFPVEACQNVKARKNRNYSSVEIESDAFTKNVQHDDLGSSILPKRGAGTERKTVDRFLGRGQWVSLCTLQKTVPMHPMRELVRVIRLFCGMLCKDPSKPCIFTQRVSQAQRLSELA